MQPFCRAGVLRKLNFVARSIKRKPVNISFTGFPSVFFNHDLSLVHSSMAMNKIALTKKMLVSLERERIVKRKLWKISPS